MAVTKQTKARNDQNIDEFTKIFNNEMPKTMKIENTTDEKEINYGPALKKLFTIAKQPKNKQVPVKTKTKWQKMADEIYEMCISLKESWRARSMISMSIILLIRSIGAILQSTLPIQKVRTITLCWKRTGNR